MNKKEFFGEIKKLGLDNSATKDILLAHDGVKPSCRVYIDDSKLNKSKKLFQKHGLFLASSEFRHSGPAEKGKGGFSDKRKRVPLGHGGLRCYYISKTKKISEEAKKHEYMKDHEKFGRILGYPDCCVRFFRDISMKINRNGFVSDVMGRTRGKPPYDFRNNFISQYFGFSLLSHFPCSFNCRNSARLAEKYFSVIRSYSKEWAQKFTDYQKSAILFTEDAGIFLLKEFSLEKNILKYDSLKMRTTLENGISKKLGEGDNIKMVNKNHIMIRKGSFVLKEMKGKNICMCIFK